MTDPNTNPKPVETKVIASTVGAGVGSTLTIFFVWLLDEYVWKASDVPDPVQAMIGLVVGSGLAFWAGYRAKHTPA